MKRANEESPSVTYTKSKETCFPNAFSLCPVGKFNRPFPNFGQPKEISHFSINSQREISLDTSSLKYLHDKNVGCKVKLNLRDGYQSFISSEDTLCDIETDSLLKWVDLYIGKENILESHKPEFISWRGLITKLLVTPYETSEGWSFAVQKFNDIIFLCELETEQKIKNKKNETERMKEMSYWGFKFEQYMTSEKIDGHPETTVPVNNNVSFSSVVRTKLDNHSLIFAGEVDCCLKDDVKTYVELKTNRKIETHHQRENFNRYKLLKWWAQSFLIGISEIVCGFRDDDGIVHNTEVFKTLDIPKLCRNSKRPWSGNVCFNFLKDLLQFIKDAASDEKSIYKFEWSPNQDVRWQIVSDVKVLPDWFITKLQSTS